MPPARFVLYVTTVVVLAMTGFALLAHPPPLGWAAAALVFYFSLLLGGVFLLRWRVFVDAIVRGPPGARGVVLTFDDGPHPQWTPRVLDLLAQHQAKATFFVIGRKAEAHPEVVRAIVERGHALGLHSHDHDWFFALRHERRVREDLEKGLATLERITGKRPMLFRPPVGLTNPIIARVADALDLVTVGWTVGAGDGVAFTPASQVTARIRRSLRDGAIVLLHDSPEHGDREPVALSALPTIFDAIGAAGLDVASIAEWVDVPQAEGSRT